MSEQPTHPYLGSPPVLLCVIALTAMECARAAAAVRKSPPDLPTAWLTAERAARLGAELDSMLLHLRPLTGLERAAPKSRKALAAELLVEIDRQRKRLRQH